MVAAELRRSLHRLGRSAGPHPVPTRLELSDPHLSLDAEGGGARSEQLH